MVSPEATPEGHHFLTPQSSSSSSEAPATSPLLLPDVFPPFPRRMRGPEQRAPASLGLRPRSPMPREGRGLGSCSAEA